MNRLSKSGIEYLTHMWSPFSGCRNHVNGVCAVGSKCWAKAMTMRFKSHYPNGSTYYPEALLSPLGPKKPARIGVAWLGDMIGYADPELKISMRSAVANMRSRDDEAYLSMATGKPSIVDIQYEAAHELKSTFKEIIYSTMKLTPRHTYLILTKNPERLKLWEPFPENCLVGVSATDSLMFVDAMNSFLHVRAKVKFISFEPLLKWDIEPYIFETDLTAQQLDWIIIGQQTPIRKSTTPKIEWIREIVGAANKAGIPVWLKDNILELVNYESPETNFAFNKDGEYRQELPK